MSNLDFDLHKSIKHKIYLDSIPSMFELVSVRSRTHIVKTRVTRNLHQSKTDTVLSEKIKYLKN